MRIEKLRLLLKITKNIHRWKSCNIFHSVEGIKTERFLILWFDSAFFSASTVSEKNENLFTSSATFTIDILLSIASNFFFFHFPTLLWNTKLQHWKTFRGKLQNFRVFHERKHKHRGNQFYINFLFLRKINAVLPSFFLTSRVRKKTWIFVIFPFHPHCAIAHKSSVVEIIISNLTTTLRRPKPSSFHPNSCYKFIRARINPYVSSPCFRFSEHNEFLSILYTADLDSHSKSPSICWYKLWECELRDATCLYSYNRHIFFSLPFSKWKT